ncbi:MAG TPA: bacteriohopanetetrol glucosamine biosynthesis glycosyltransferase HpnI [Pararobbsia sp.]|nr:bacteriohopanetetrol glucosamine biosynthesis glycosyltransferase HpnI [Pararobbsia sp.]
MHELIRAALGCMAIIAALVIAHELPAVGHGVDIVLTTLFAVLTALGCLYAFVSGLLTVPFFKRHVGAPTDCPPVTVLRPLHGHEHALLDNLSSFFHQTYPAPVQFIFGVHDANDAALDTVHALRLAYPDVDMTIVTDAQLHGPNRKISNLMNMFVHAKHEMLVFADSDVAVSPDYLSNAVATLQDPGVGLVSCLYHGRPDAGFWPRLSAAASNYHFTPSVVFGLATKMARPCFGPIIAMRRATLERIGGLAPFAWHLAEDQAIGDAVRELGECVEIPAFTVFHACVEPTLRDFLKHKLRASRTIRRITPAGHLGSILTYPLALALLTCLTSGGMAWAFVLLAIALATRVFAGVQADRALGATKHGLWVLPVCDLLLFGVFIASFTSSRVVWRGHQFTVDPSGLMTLSE